MSRTWKQKAGGLIILGVGLIIAAVMGLFVYMAVTATPLHPNPQAMPSVAGSARPAQQVGPTAWIAPGRSSA